MQKNNQSNWAGHHKMLEGMPPKPLLIKALEFVHNKESALDLGAGALIDSEYLASQGFKEIVTLDIEPSVSKRKHSKPIKIVISSFKAMTLPSSKYDLVTSQFSLPFIKPDSFLAVIKKISDSLKKNGIFTGQLFGVNDEWKNNPNMTFYTNKQARSLFNDFEIIQINEKEYDGTLTDGTPKHWHVFFFIVKKK